jgi:SulP family sulfate permease
MVDLTVAMEVGLVLACLFFVYRMSTLFGVEIEPIAPPGVRICKLYGSLFFGAVAKLERVGENLPAGTKAVILEMHQLVSIDSSGLDALQQLHRHLRRQDVRLVLCALNAQPMALMRQAEFDAVLGPEDLQPNVTEALARLTAAVSEPVRHGAAGGLTISS